MIGELLGEVVGWVVGEILGGVLELVWPKRVSGFAVVAAWLVIGAIVWAATHWWRVDPASDRRTQVVVLTSFVLLMIGMMLTLSYDGAVQERKRLRRESAGVGVLRNQRLRGC